MSTNKVGSYLKEERLKRNYTLDQIAQQTKISKNLLIQIEEGDIYQIPKIYARGHISAIARVLEIDSTNAIQIYEDNLPQEEIAPVAPPPKFKITYYHYLAIGLLLLLLIYHYRPREKEIVRQETDNPIKSISLGNNEEVEKLAPKIKAEILNQQIEQSDEGLSPSASADTLATNSSSDHRQSLPSPATEEEEGVEEKKERIFDPRLNSKPPLFVTVEQDDDYQYLPAHIAKLVQENSDQDIVYIYVHQESSWLAYQQDSNKVKDVTLQKGNSLLLQGELIKLLVGNINNLTIFFNGKLVKAYSKSGVRSLVFPPKAAAHIKLPLFIFQADGSIQDASIANQ